MDWRPRKLNLKFQPCRQICPLGPKTSPQTSSSTLPPSRKGSPCGGEEGNQVYFVRRAFCASNTWLSGKSAKRMKHEVSFSKCIWIPPYSYNVHTAIYPQSSAPHGFTTGAPGRRRIWRILKLWKFSQQLLITTTHLKAEIASFMSS